MTDVDFLTFITEAAANRSIVTGEQVNRLLRLSGSDMAYTLPANWRGMVDPANVDWTVGRARRNGVVA